MRRDFVLCEFGSDHGARESGCGFYQTGRRSFTGLEFEVKSDKNELSVKPLALPEKCQGIMLPGKKPKEFAKELPTWKKEERDFQQSQLSGKFTHLFSQFL